jgi:c-di-GMP-binding flagellar brake protein YcgR
MEERGMAGQSGQADQQVTHQSRSDRRSHSRHAVDTSARLLLINSRISMAGRILNLSLGGCRIRTEEQFNVGIYIRVEAEFRLHGLPFRVGGVSQAILDRNTIGVRFLDMSERRREQLKELIAEITEAEALEATGA